MRKLLDLSQILFASSVISLSQIASQQVSERQNRAVVPRLTYLPFEVSLTRVRPSIEIGSRRVEQEKQPGLAETRRRVASRRVKKSRSALFRSNCLARRRDRRRRRRLRKAEGELSQRVIRGFSFVFFDGNKTTGKSTLSWIIAIIARDTLPFRARRS